jgi:enterochelin esterase-like enzyme
MMRRLVGMPTATIEAEAGGSPCMRSVSPIALMVSLLMAASSPSPGQEPRRDPPRRPMPPPPVRSPEVQKDGRVTFRFRAPNAKEVLVARDGAARSAMQKDDPGVWSLTTDPLPPDIYPYSFVADGTTLADPANPMVKPIVMGGNQSLVHVPGPSELTWEVNDVPRGTLHRHFYKSAIAGEGRDFHVYTPPGYDPAGKGEYPVLYLLHGITDDASAWTTAGQAHVILDNLIARGRARPMVVVMPLGYAFPDVPRDLFKLFGDKARQRESLEKFSATVLDELIPQVEKAYRVAGGRESRAIAGLSMGGAQALYIGLNHPDRFGWAGSFSGAFVMFGDDYAGHFPALDAQAASKFRLVWLACGTEDFLIEPHRKFERWLKEKGVAFRSKETPGAHTWMVWRRYLTDLAPLLFRPAKP